MRVDSILRTTFSWGRLLWCAESWTVVSVVGFVSGGEWWRIGMWHVSFGACCVVCSHWLLPLLRMYILFRTCCNAPFWRWACSLLIWTFRRSPKSRCSICHSKKMHRLYPDMMARIVFVSLTALLCLGAQLLACSINAACAALVDAGVAMKGLVSELVSFYKLHYCISSKNTSLVELSNGGCPHCQIWRGFPNLQGNSSNTLNTLGGDFSRIVLNISHAKKIYREWISSSRIFTTAHFSMLGPQRIVRCSLDLSSVFLGT